MKHSYSKIFQKEYENEITNLRQFTIVIKKDPEGFEFNLRLSTLPPFSYKMEMQEEIDMVNKVEEPYPYELTF